jgi:anti-sigma factor RsiW
MTCAEAREALLVADLAQLEAATGALHEHLAACPGCRRDAARILAAHDALRAQVARPAPGAAADAARRAIAEGRALARRRRRWMVPLLVAAAGVAIVLLVPRDRAARAPAVAVTVTRPTPPPLVEAAGAHVAVITTRRPDITVVWQF